MKHDRVAFVSQINDPVLVDGYWKPEPMMQVDVETFLIKPNNTAPMLMLSNMKHDRVAFVR